MALQDFFVPCRIMDRKSVPDGYGGFTYQYVDGAKFSAGISTDSSTEARIAYQQGLKVMYSVVTGELVSLKQGDVIKRISDGLLLRITSDAVDMTTPAVAKVKFRKVTAEAVKV